MPVSFEHFSNEGGVLLGQGDPPKFVLIMMFTAVIEVVAQGNVLHPRCHGDQFVHYLHPDCWDAWHELEAAGSDED